MARSAHREAVAYFEQALSALSHLPERRDTREQAIDLRLALRSALVRCPALRGVSWRICVRPKPSPWPSTTRVGWDRSLRFLSIAFTGEGAYDQAIAAGQRALALATADGDGVLQAQANHRLGQAYQAQGDYRRAIDYFGQTVASLEGEQRHERFGDAHPARRSLPGQTRRVPCRAGDIRRGQDPGGRRAAGSPKRTTTRRAVSWPRGGLVGSPSARATCPGLSLCWNGPWASVRTQTSCSGFPP